MIIERVHVRNFLSHADTTLDFTAAPLWLICGENGAGKSATFDAIEFALYGCHRGGNRQGSQYLVKHGSEQGVIEVVLTLGDERFRITHHLHHHRGNTGSTLERENDQGVWTPLNVGSSAVRVWDWLEPRIPAIDLFRSAIYLRQGETAHFMSGNAAERMDRFAKLIDLSRYTELSERSRTCAAEFTKAQVEAKAKLVGLGDISDDALGNTEALAAESNKRLKEAAQAHKQAQRTTAGAVEWERLQQECTSLEAERNRLQALLKDADQIRADATAVQQWDRVAVTLAMYWEHCERAERLRTSSQSAAAEATSKRAAASTLQTEKRGVQEERRNIVEELLPRAKELAALAWERTRDLEHEAKIAAARCSLDMSTRKSLVLHLRTVADAHHAVDTASAALDAAHGRVTVAQKIAEEAAKAARDAEVTFTDWERKDAEAARVVSSLTTDIARLEGQIASHGRLGGADRECPVCAQPVSDKAHDHVREVLANEEATLATLNEQRASAVNRQKDVSEALAKSRAAKAEAVSTAHDASTALARAEERVPHIEQGLMGAQQALVEATTTLTANHPAYAQDTDAITPEWMEQHSAELMAGLEDIDFKEVTLTTAQHAQVHASATLQMLQSQRRAGAEKVGEHLPSDVIERDAAAARHSAEAYDGDIRKHETRVQELDHRLAESDTRITALEEQAAAKAEIALTACADADTEDKKAGRLQSDLGSTWAGVLASKDTYEATMHMIEACRPNAQRAPELDRAAGELDHVISRLQDTIQVRDATDIAHRLPVKDAREAEDWARRAELDALEAKTRAKGAVALLERQREAATTYREEIAAAEVEGKTYTDLADLLKEGGAIQVEVAGREQRAIVREVNAVLSLIHDSLQVQLGAPQRASRIQLQDVLVIDTTDPVGAPRYFDYLSGGEKFRVALALALALHRRVDGGAVGTLIVDEGFGSLDGDRRDELALQMTDTSHGLLQQRLANNIIVSTHSSEVQRHFPYRYAVTKEAGTATVECYEAEDALIDA